MEKKQTGRQIDGLAYGHRQEEIKTDTSEKR